MDSRVAAYLSILIAMAHCSNAEEWSPSCACVRIYKPLCGSDGRTYNSPCEFDCRRKELNKKKEVQKEGVYHHEELKAVPGRCDGSE